MIKNIGVEKVKRTERGWIGHFIGGDNCRFRRNTLLEYGDCKIVVSTVGNYVIDGVMMSIGSGRYFETMAFHAKRVDDLYWDANISRKVSFESNWCLYKDVNDNEVNQMHEAVVEELSTQMVLGVVEEGGQA